MLTLGAITFQTAAALWALLLLPLIWWLLKITPPRPERVSFPPIRFLLGLIAREETPHKTPWWLTLIRMALALCLILAIARPVINEDSTAAQGGNDPLLLVIDDSWAAADNWTVRLRLATEVVDRARSEDRPVVLVTTTPKSTPPTLEPRAAAEVADRIAAVTPQALPTDRMRVAEALREAFGATTKFAITWLSDGLDSGDVDGFATALTGLGGGSTLQVVLPAADQTGIALSKPALAGDGLEVTATRANPQGTQTVRVRALAHNGRSLAEQAVTFQPGETQARAVIQLPLQLRNDIGRLDVDGRRSAGSVYLLDDRWSRKSVGLEAAGSLEANQPLLAPLYYVTRALEPYAELVPLSQEAKPGESGLQNALAAGLSMLILADIGQMSPADRDSVRAWVDRGGMLVRFAGPRFAASHDDLVPVQLREGDRALGGALSWEEPQPIAPFDEGTPFAGIPVPPEITVTKQVLAQPTADLATKVWARLADGTPLVTAEQHGKGMIVLFHVTANADWSNLPLSGVFVEMLQRLLDLAPGAVSSDAGSSTEDQAKTANSKLPQGNFSPVRTLNGFGELIDPPADARPVALADFDTLRPSPMHPAGLYGRDGRTRALNLFEEAPELKLIGDLPAGVNVSTYRVQQSVSLAGPLLLAALALFLVDFLAVLVLSGTLGQIRSLFAADLALAILASGLALSPPPAEAQETVPNPAFAMESALSTKLAYVRTGNPDVDAVSEAGLTGLTAALIERTAVEADAPVGIDIETDEIVFFPLLYWPILPDAPALSPQASARVDAYLKNGGTILFDTRDHGTSLQDLTGATSPGTRALQLVLRDVNVPQLTMVPPEHVLTKSFYLLQNFPGRWDGGPLWVEAAGNGGSGAANFDGVSSVIIGSNDYAAAWAVDQNGQPMYDTSPGGERQREMALRTGINVVMYVLTGNYKADQVHVPALLERLGQ